ncbi:MAG: class I SAM-dependent methyltransferase, partial [Sulfurovum sp.]|nr:class I SAM-dependent methyltransferase [Sulfurovum sp.]
NTSCDDSEDWANCVAGTLRQEELIESLEKAGFKDVTCTGLTHYTTAKTTQGATFSASKVPAIHRRKKHWDSLFKTKDYTQVFWHQSSPTRSLNLIQKYANKEDAIIDVGCGASVLVDALIDNGYEDISLLDTSSTCLNIVKKRLNTSVTPKYICSDLLMFKATQPYKLWHDRAVFHFLLSKKERETYFTVLSESLDKEGYAIINTFAPDGEISCAGLQTRAYNREMMLAELPDTLKLIDYESFTHITPKNIEQSYSLFVIQKNEC